jgi:ubiquinone/menaquinone biosynthesis C-methylase UbiE
MHHLAERPASTGITLRAFRLNSVLNHILFTGRRGRVYDQLVVLSGVQPGDRVLDVGSSSGFLTVRLAAVAGPAGQVTGLDPAEPAIAHARRQARPGLTFRVGVAQDLGLPGASLDLVTCTLALHHIPAPQRPAVLAEMYRVTRPGGRLLVADLASVIQARTGGLTDLAATAGYQVESAGRLPVLRYVVAVRPRSARA